MYHQIVLSPSKPLKNLALRVRSTTLSTLKNFQCYVGMCGHDNMIELERLASEGSKHNWFRPWIILVDQLS